MSDERRSCSVMAWLLLSWAIAALLLIAVVVAIATPRSAVHVGAERLAAVPSEGRGISTEHDRLSGAPLGTSRHTPRLTVALPGPIPGSTLRVRERAEPAPIRGCSVISWVILSWVIAAVAGIALLVWWAW